MLHCAAFSGCVIQFTKVRAACCCSGVADSNRKELPPPVGLPPFFACGMGATPKSIFALLRTLVRLPVVVHMLAVLPSRKSLGVVPQSIVPCGMTLWRYARSYQNCRASTTAGLSK